MLKKVNFDLLTNKVTLFKGGVCALALVVIVTLPGCKSDDKSGFLFDVVDNASVNEQTGVYTITMRDGDVYNITKEDIEQTYDYPIDPMYEEPWCPKMLVDTGGELDDITNITSDSQYQEAIRSNDLVLVKRVR